MAWRFTLPLRKKKTYHTLQMSSPMQKSWDVWQWEVMRSRGWSGMTDVITSGAVHYKRQSWGSLCFPFYVLSPFYLLSQDSKGSGHQLLISLDFLASRTMSQHRSAHNIPSQVLWKRVTNRLRQCLMNKTSQIQSIRLYNRENVSGLAGLDPWITISGVNELKEQSVLGKSSTFLFPVEAQDVTIISTKLSLASLSLDEGDTITLRIHFTMPTSHWFMLLAYIYGFLAWSGILNCK